MRRCTQEAAFLLSALQVLALPNKVCKKAAPRLLCMKLIGFSRLMEPLLLTYQLCGCRKCCMIVENFLFARSHAVRAIYMSFCPCAVIRLLLLHHWDAKLFRQSRPRLAYQIIIAKRPKRAAPRLKKFSKRRRVIFEKICGQFVLFGSLTSYAKTWKFFMQYHKTRDAISTRLIKNVSIGSNKYISDPQKRHPFRQVLVAYQKGAEA